MEGLLIYPDESIKPVCIEDGFRDYTLSALFRNHKIKNIRLFPYDLDMVNPLLCARAYVELDDGALYYWEVLPANRCPVTVVDQDILHECDDMIIRIYRGGDEREIVRWISLLYRENTVLTLNGFETIYGPMRSFWCLYKSMI